MTAEPPGERHRTPVRLLRPEQGARAGLAALLRGRCPRCRRGRIFTGLLRMASTCEMCGLRFEREPGYFTGAMYVSYAMALPIFVGVFLLLERLLPDVSVEVVLLLMLLAFLPFVPFVFRYSRIFWIHLDRAIDADEP